MNEYIITQLNENNLKDLIPLYKDAFKKNFSIDFFKKKFSTDDYGLKYLGFLAYAPDGTPAAYYGVFPIKIQYKNKTYLCAQSGDTMTHSQHRGKQLFTKLAIETYKFAEKNGVQFVFGFPNKNSYPGFVKYLNWTCDTKMNEFKFSVSTLPLGAIAKKFDALQAVYNLYLSIILLFFKKSIKHFENSVLSDDVVAIPHDMKYFNYKTYSCNTFIKLAGLDCWIKFDGALVVGDINKNDVVNVKKIIKALKLLAFFTGSRKVMLQFSRGTFWDKEFTKVLSSKEGLIYGYVNFTSDLPLEQLKFCLGDTDTF